MINIKKWYSVWESELPSNIVRSLHKPSVEEIMEHFQQFLDKHIQGIQSFEVLNALPGHGKTITLKLFIKKMIQLKQTEPIGGMIVLREKEQMRDIEQFVKGSSLDLLYVDSENYHEIKDSLSTSQFIIITHERLKSLALNITKLEKDDVLIKESILNPFLKWGNHQRMIIIDEAPNFVDSVIFDVGGELDWLDDCFNENKQSFAKEEIIMIRSYIQILLAQEVLERENGFTEPLKQKFEGQHAEFLLNSFFKRIDESLEKITDKESLRYYLWFKRLFYNEQVGYIDNGLYSENYSDHKKIICSDRIDYRQLGCSILILDGTAQYTPSIYNNEYQIQEIKNNIDYTRLCIYQRVIRTTASKRKSKSGVTTQQIIAKDIESLRNQQIYPFPLMNKSDIDTYRQLQVITDEFYRKYFDPSTNNNVLPINLLNTTGKNYLAENNSLYLTALPNRPPAYYKSIAVSLFKYTTPPLDMSTEYKDKGKKNSWFADDRIETVYNETLLSELFQIIHRSNIRNLQLSSSKKVHIYIATHFENSIKKLRQTLPGHTFFQSSIENTVKLQIKIEPKIKALADKIITEDITLPKSVGKLTTDSSLKNQINKHWNNEVDKQEIIKVFHHYGLDINENGKRKEKRINHLNNSNSESIE